MIDETLVGAVIYALTCRLPRNPPRADATRASTQRRDPVWSIPNSRPSSAASCARKWT